MILSVKTQKIEKAVNDLEKANKVLRDAQLEIQNVSNKLKNKSSSFSNVSNILAMEVKDLDMLISKLATMEDGLERAIDLYLQYERKISGDVAWKSLEIESNKKSKKRSWWNDVLDWIETGVWRNDEKAERIRSDKAMAKELKKLIKSERYSKKTWKKATIEERKQILRELLEEMQKIYGVSLNNIMISSIESEPGYITYGYFQNSSGTICINADLLNDVSNYKNIIDTLAHEMRHAYQYAVISNPENYQVDEETVEEWRENFNDYKTTDDDGYQAYRNQPIEKDAREFASWVI